MQLQKSKQTNFQNLKTLEDIFTTIVSPVEDKPGFTEPPGGLIPAGSGNIYNVSNYFGRPVERASGKITSTTGTKIKGAGPDTQLIAAQPGEFIVSKNAVNTYGSQFFMNLNKEGGGTNIPNFINNIGSICQRWWNGWWIDGFFN